MNTSIFLFPHCQICIWIHTKHFLWRDIRGYRRNWAEGCFIFKELVCPWVCRTIVRTTCSLLSVLHYLVPTLLQSLYNCASCNWLVGIPFESSQSIVLLLQYFARVQSARTAYYWTTIYNTKNLTTLLNVPKYYCCSRPFFKISVAVGNCWTTVPLGVWHCQWYCPSCVVKGSTVV